MANKIVDITGQRFGRLMARFIVAKKPFVTWRCSCDCGGEKDVVGTQLRQGVVKSCGCLLGSDQSDAEAFIGSRINDWECVSFIQLSKRGYVYLWRHANGSEVIKTKAEVKLGRGTRRADGTAKSTSRVSQFHTPTRNTHRAMLARCCDPRHVAYARYGGRGISIDPTWQDYASFVADMGLRPDGCELDRKDNDLGYCRDNCRWVTRKENLRNTSVNATYEYDGRQLSVAEIADMAGIPYARAYSRLRYYGFNVEQTLRGYK